jgi:hypothetical protein
MIKIEDYPTCNNGIESRKRERKIYEQLFENKLNSQRPYITDEEKREQKVMDLSKSNAKNNGKNSIRCVCDICGGTKRQLYPQAHYNTLKHQRALQQQHINTNN